MRKALLTMIFILIFIASSCVSSRNYKPKIKFKDTVKCSKY